VALAPVSEAPLASRLDFAAGGRSMLVHRATDAVAEPTSERDAPARSVEAQVRRPVGVVDCQAA
jgi:hypothetical protein